MADLSQLASAEGLTQSDAATVQMLYNVMKRRMANNRLRVKYYEDKQDKKLLGLTVPPDFMSKVDTSVGWCAKAVDMLASRSIYDGMSTIEGQSEELNAILDANDLADKYADGVASELIHGCGFWTVSQGEDGSPLINYYDALSASGVWDYAKNRIKAGMVVSNYEYDSNGKPHACEVLVHFADHYVQIAELNGAWHAVAYPNPMGRPLMEAMCYRPSYAKKFGKSRISKACMGITDEMVREIMRTALHSELFSAPPRYLLGASEESFDKSKFSLYMDSFLLATKDEDGDMPQIGQLAQASIEPHIKAQELLMSRMAAETACPVAAFGLSSNGYTSSDALRASTDDLIIEAEALNKGNGKALRNVAMMALAMGRNSTLADLDYVDRSIAIQWKNPAVPSIAAQTDAMVKQASVAPWMTETSVYLEELGYSDEQRRRIQSERKSAEATQALNAALFGAA